MRKAWNLAKRMVMNAKTIFLSKMPFSLASKKELLQI